MRKRKAGDAAERAGHGGVKVGGHGGSSQWKTAPRAIGEMRGEASGFRWCARERRVYGCEELR